MSIVFHFSVNSLKKMLKVYFTWYEHGEGEREENERCPGSSKTPFGFQWVGICLPVLGNRVCREVRVQGSW